MNLPKLETFLKKIYKSWETGKTLMEKAKEAMKKQFDKRRQNSQCYNLRLNNQLKEKPCIEFTQENSIEFLSIIYPTYVCQVVGPCYTQPRLS